MSKGDILARGGKTAQFQQVNQMSELESDLKIFSREIIKEKYGVFDEDYDMAVLRLQHGDKLPDWKPFDVAPQPVFMPEGAPHNGVIPEVEERPRVGYEGDPTGDCVLVIRVEREHTSNLIMPDSLKAKNDIGFIKAIGEAVKFYKKGDLILFDKFASHGADISLIDEEGIERAMLLLREYDILMRLKKITLQNRMEP